MAHQSQLANELRQRPREAEDKHSHLDSHHGSAEAAEHTGKWFCRGDFQSVHLYIVFSVLVHLDFS